MTRMPFSIEPIRAIRGSFLCAKKPSWTRPIETCGKGRRRIAPDAAERLFRATKTCGAPIRIGRIGVMRAVGRDEFVERRRGSRRVWIVGRQGIKDRDQCSVARFL